MLDYRRAKVRACDVLTYKADYGYERRMIAQIKVVVKPVECVGCGDEFNPRYVGDQACGKCRN